VHVRDGEVYAVNGSARGDLKGAVEAGIDLEAAILAAQQAQEPIQGLHISDDAPLAYRIGKGQLDLVYLVDVTGTRRDGLQVHDVVVVSAADGSILQRMPLVHDAKNREMHNLNHGTSLPGPVSRTEGQAPTGESTVDANYDLLGWVYDCYKNLFNRDSFDGAGAKLVSSVHYSTNYCNAFWNGSQMVYGDGDGGQCGNLALSMDVTAHELTHAVTQYESNLTYSGESGGLNEAMSDIFGNVCEWYRDGQVVSADTWLVGEDIWTPSTPGDALRYMNDPAKDGASLDLWTSGAGGVDVHYSSGIANLAFYLLSQGGTHPRGKTSVSVPAIGINKASQVFYRANSTYMTSSTNYAAARTTTLQAATDLYGAASAEVTAVGKAWEAVGVGGSSPPPGGCSHDKCATGGSLVNGCTSCVSSICGVDPYCCSTYWDSICVGEVRTVCGSLTCAESNGSCAHGLCTAGGALVNSCDSAQANCVASICAVDSYCCTYGWDSICVGEVASVCGKNCN
jgi:vibriolysin